MSYLNIVLIAISLSFDGMAVGAANGAYHHQMSFFKALKIAVFFGLFHFLMPVFGWLVGVGLKQIISGFDHWIAFVLLLLLGIKFILESRKNVEERKIDIHSFKILFLLSVATSVDALVVGITFAFLPINVFLSSLIIGFVILLLSLCSVYIGKQCGEKFGKKAEVAGGIILMIIAFKILLGHLL